MTLGKIRAWAPIVLVLATCLSGTGCKRVRQALLGDVDAGVTAVSMSLPQVDTQSNNIYRIFVSALDQSGNPLAGLRIGNFSILENGGPGVPIDVGPVTDPLYVVLVIDRSGSMFGARTTAANTAAITLVNALSSDDYAAIIDFDDAVTLAQGFTNDKTALINVINAGVPDGATAVYDATVAGAQLLLNPAGRRLLLVLTDGEDNSSGHTAEDTIKNVNDRGLSANMVALGATAGGTTLAQIANATAGIYAESLTGSDLSSIFLSILNRYQNLTAIRYRRHESGRVTAYLNYGDLTASASKELD